MHSEYISSQLSTGKAYKKNGVVVVQFYLCMVLSCKLSFLYSLLFIDTHQNKGNTNLYQK